MSMQGRRKGIGLKMTAMLIDLAFHQLRLHRVTSYLRSDNTASSELLTKLGFTQEGLMRKNWFSGGQHHDTIAVGLLAEEWAEARKSVENAANAQADLIFGRAPWPGRKWPEPSS